MNLFRPRAPRTYVASETSMALKPGIVPDLAACMLCSARDGWLRYRHAIAIRAIHVRGVRSESKEPAATGEQRKCFGEPPCHQYTCLSKTKENIMRFRLAYLIAHGTRLRQMCERASETPSDYRPGRCRTPGPWKTLPPHLHSPQHHIIH